jgi:hypothetical protein
LISKRDWEGRWTDIIAGDAAAMSFAVYEPDSILRTCYLGGSGGVRGEHDMNLPSLKFDTRTRKFTTETSFG